MLPQYIYTQIPYVFFSLFLSSFVSCGFISKCKGNDQEPPRIVLDPIVSVTLEEAKVDPASVDHLWASVFVHNPNPFPITFYEWDSPLDCYAASLGVFKLYSEHGMELDVGRIFLSRILPLNYQDLLIEIPAYGMVQARHDLRDVLWKLRSLSEGKYFIRAKGFWRHVWECPKDQVTAEMAGGAIWGVHSFESKPVQLIVTSLHPSGQ